jgi:hypothetical protein
MSLQGLESQAFKSVNSDTCPQVVSTADPASLREYLEVR